MSDISINLARKDELSQTFTSEDMAEIKSAIQIPRGNVSLLNTVYSPIETQVGWWQEYRTVEGQQVLMQKPLYEMTVTGTSGGADVEKVILSDTTLNNVTIVSGSIKNKNSATWYQIPYIYHITPSAEYCVVKYKSALGLTMQAKGDVATADFWLTIQYTKTTDEWQEVV